MLKCLEIELGSCTVDANRKRLAEGAMHPIALELTSVMDVDVDPQIARVRSALAAKT